MTERYWFRRRRYGFGISPASPAGWLATLLLGGVLFALGLLFLSGPTADPLRFAIGALIAIAAFLLMALRRLEPRE